MNFNDLELDNISWDMSEARVSVESKDETFDANQEKNQELGKKMNEGGIEM
jgi:hypothetical protein